MSDGLMEVPSRRESNCVRCRNHGMKVTLRGHKQYCPYASCSCDKCRFTSEQQRQMRLQNAIRRSEATDRVNGGSIAKRARELSLTPTPTMVALPHHQPQTPQQIQSPPPQIVTVTVQSAPAHAHQQIANGISGTMAYNNLILNLIALGYYR